MQGLLARVVRPVNGAGGPISLRLHGTDHAGHAVARRDDRGRVTVTVRLGVTGAGGAP